MSISLFIILFNVFLIFLFFRLSNKNAFLGTLSFDYTFFIGLGFFLYSFFYLLEKYVKNLFTNNVFSFASDVAIALIFFILGNIACQLLIKKKISFNSYLDNDQSKPKTFYLSTRKIVIAFLLLFVLLQIYMTIVFGGWIIYFTQVYGEYKMEGINSFTVIIPLLCSSFVLFFNSSFIHTTKRNKIVVFLCSIFLVIIFILGGNRNLGMMIAISLMWSKFFRKKFNFYKFIPILVVGLILTSINAIGRQYGLINYISGSVSVPYDVVLDYVLSVSNGEFGTMARVVDYSREFNFNLQTFPGYSYIVDPLVTLIPTFVWEHRPHTIAVEFTKQYWGGLGEGTEGLGFSPILESKLNFGFFWPLIFFYLSFVIKFLEIIISKSSKRSYYYFFGSFSAVSLNFYRIDFAITFKFAILIFIFTILLEKIILTKIFFRSPY
jgi:hypothetical protein